MGVYVCVCYYRGGVYLDELVKLESPNPIETECDLCKVVCTACEMPLSQSPVLRARQVYAAPALSLAER